MVGGMEGHAATIRVGPREEIKSIKTAVAKAKSGDTVRVIGGEYAEGNIVIRTSLTLVGEGHPVIDGEKAHEPISILAPNVTIDGFTIKASGHSSLRDIAGIKIYDRSEEHTSELQSRENLVCRLLLEKKKKK